MVCSCSTTDLSRLLARSVPLLLIAVLWPSSTSFRAFLVALRRDLVTLLIWVILVHGLDLGRINNVILNLLRLMLPSILLGLVTLPRCGRGPLLTSSCCSILTS